MSQQFELLIVSSSDQGLILRMGFAWLLSI